jgi:hypothetical protein
MKLSFSLPVQFVMTAVLAAALGFAIPVLVDRPKYARAVASYTKEPNVENEAALRFERATNRRIVWTTRAEAVGVLFVMMNAGRFLARRQQRKSSLKPLDTPKS